MALNTVPINELRTYIHTDVPTAPIPTVDRAILQSTIEFCRQSQAIRENIPAITLATDTAQYVPTVATGMMPVAIKSARVVKTDGSVTALKLTSPKELEDRIPDWDEKAGTPLFVFLTEDNEIAFAPKPNGQYNGLSVKIELAVKPVRNATVIPEKIVEDYSESIRAGAISKILSMPNYEWTDMNTAAIYEQKFTIMQAQAKNIANREGQSRSRKTRFSY